jgi:hypothetical protein
MSMLGKAFIIIICLICACVMRLAGDNQFSEILLILGFVVAFIPSKYER